MIEKKSKWGKRGTVNFYFSFLAVICSNMKFTSRVKLSRRLVIWEANEITKIIAIVYKTFPLTIKEHVTFALNNSVRGAAMC